jgi:hypothetical protein
MTKFVIVSEPPKTLEKGEVVVKVPDFKEEIEENRGKAPATKRTAVNHLRAIAGSIGHKYDRENFNPFTHAKPALFEGIEYASDEELSKVVVKMIEQGYPSIFESAIDYQIKNRPMGTKVIYFVGPWNLSGPFTKNGIDVASLEEAEVIMGRKEKKPVGKPMQKAPKPESDSTPEV